MYNREFQTFVNRRNMADKVNAKSAKVRVEELAQHGDGKKELLPDILTEGEKVQVAIMFERLNALQAQLGQVRNACSELITTIVVARGFDPKKYGVNLAAGRVLPVDVPKEP